MVYDLKIKSLLKLLLLYYAAEVPIKKYKKYKDDPTIPVPRMTQYRKKIKASRANGEQNADQMLGPSNRTLDDNPTLRDAQDDFISDENDLHVDHGDAEDDLFSSEDEPHVMEHSEEQLLPTSIQSSESEEAEFGVDPSIRTSNILTCDAQDGFLAQSSTHPILSSSIRKPNILTCVDHRDAEDNLFSSKDEHFVMKGSKEQLLVMSIQSSESEESIENDEMSGLSEFSESSSESSYASSDSDSKDTDDTSTLEQPADSMPVLTECEEKYMTFLAYSSRHCLNTEAVNDLINLFAVHNPQETDIKNASFSKMKSAIGDIKAKIYDFCIKCHSLFPEDENITECGVPNCKGLRFKGTKTQQALKQRKSYFACTAIEQQIKDILERRGMWKSVKDYRKKCEDDQGIKDIHNGEMYQSLREPGQFLANENNISLMFNTDGVPLYNSSKVSIWPVYLVINELPPMHRFSRQNMILWGVWQAKGKPTFQTFFRPFIQDMISLKMDGFALDIEGSTVNCKAILLAGTLDLQAKAMVMEMTHHNGEFGCLTCEMPGTVVAQGKGHARVFPFSNEPFATRTSNGMFNLFITRISRK